MKTKIVVANWKMNKNAEETTSFALEFKRAIPDLTGIEMGIAPPFPFLGLLAERLKGTGVGIFGQHMHAEDAGAFTGEVSAPMLVSIGCKGVIIGHSERRQLFGETDDHVARKVAKALAQNLTPILCVGESLAQRQAGTTTKIVGDQVRAGLSAIEPSQIARCVLAYEPIWAIGTGETATPEQAQEVHAAIRRVVSTQSAPHIAAGLRIQYGGSVNAANAAQLMAMPDIDGALVGGAALKPDSFTAICRAAAAAKNLA